MSTGVFPPPTPIRFSDSQKYFTAAFSKPPTPSSADTCSAQSLSMSPSVPEENVDGQPPSPPRVTITLGPGLISHIRRFRTFKCLRAFSAALRLPSQSPDIVRVSRRRGGHLTTPGYYKTHYICRWNPLQWHHRVSPSERSTSARLVYDTLSISLTWTKSQPVYPTTSKTS